MINMMGRQLADGPSVDLGVCANVILVVSGLDLTMIN
jgi:hypothetical protein